VICSPHAVLSGKISEFLY